MTFLEIVFILYLILTYQEISINLKRSDFMLSIIIFIALVAAITFFVHDWAVFIRELEKAAKGQPTDYFSKNFNNNK